MSTLKLVPRTDAMSDALTDMLMDAFRNPASQFVHGPINDENRALVREQRRQAYERAKASPNPNMYDLVAIDTSLPPDDPAVSPDGVLVGFAQWKLEKEGDMYDMEVVPPPPGGNLEAKRHFWTLADEARHRAVQGRRVMHLTLVAVNPKYQRRGAGKLLVEWGVRKAEELGIPAYLGSTREGHPLYVKCGFTELEKWDVDLRPWGVDDGTINYSFMYYPKGEVESSGVTRAELA